MVLSTGTDRPEESRLSSDAFKNDSTEFIPSTVNPRYLNLAYLK